MKKTFFIYLAFCCCAVFGPSGFCADINAREAAAAVSGAGVGTGTDVGTSEDTSGAGEVSQNSGKASGYGRQLIGRSFKVKPNDIMFIRLHGDEEGLDTPGLRVRVSPEGKIKYPYIGEVEVTGLTEDEVATKLEGLLSARIMQEPQVSVVLEERIESIMRNLKIYRILGQVKKPGKYFIISEEDSKLFAINKFLDVRGACTVLDAVIAAGGFSDYADTNGVKVRRNVGGKDKYIRVPVGYMSKTGNLAKNIQLEEGDVIVVPQTWF